MVAAARFRSENITKKESKIIIGLIMSTENQAFSVSIEQHVELSAGFTFYAY